jgi:hypothetical protein
MRYILYGAVGLLTALWVSGMAQPPEVKLRIGVAVAILAGAIIFNLGRGWKRLLTYLLIVLFLEVILVPPVWWHTVFK